MGDAETVALLDERVAVVDVATRLANTEENVDEDGVSLPFTASAVRERPLLFSSAGHAYRDWVSPMILIGSTKEGSCVCEVGFETGHESVLSGCFGSLDLWIFLRDIISLFCGVVFGVHFACLCSTLKPSRHGAE